VAVYDIQPDRVTEDIVRSMRRRFIMGLSTLVGVITISTVVLMIAGRHEEPLHKEFLLSLWDTLQLISTVGAFNDDQMAPWQRVWAIIVIALGLGAALYAFSTLQSLLHGGDVQRLYTRRKMQRTLSEMTGHMIVCGFGTVGFVVAEEIKKAGRPFVVIEQDHERAEDADRHGYLTVQGDSTLEQTLEQASIHRAVGIAATLNNDAANVLLTLTARQLNPSLRIVTRAEREESRSTLLRAGANRVLVPSESAGREVANLILQPKVSEFIAAAVGEGDFEFIELDVRTYPKMRGKNLRELNLPRTVGAIVIAILHDDGKQEFNPSADRMLDVGDTLIVVCQEGGALRMAALE
jgi:voltage-gated potassium channel